MPTFTGKFEYLIDGKKVTQEQFQHLVDGKENDYDISIDNLRVVADKKGNEPFFLDEFLFPAKNNIKFTSLVIPHKSTEDKVKTEELRGYLIENQRFNNLDTIVKIIQADNEEELKSAVKEDWTSNNTGGTVFEKVQDSTLPHHPTKEQINKAFSEDIKRNVKILTGEGGKKYSLKLDCKLPDSYIKSFNSAQEKFVENLDVYNDIVGHSTRHKAGKEIKLEDIWNDEKRKSVSQAIKKDIQSQNPEQKQQVKDLAEQYKKEDECIGKKETEGKLDYSEINFELLDLMAERFMKNKSKYPKGNTLKQINKEDLVFAAFRHLRKMIKPIKADPESFKDHLVAVSTNMSILLDQLNLEEND